MDFCYHPFSKLPSSRTKYLQDSWCFPIYTNYQTVPGFPVCWTPCVHLIDTQRPIENSCIVGSQIGTSNLQLHERPHSKLSTFVTTSQREGDSPIYVPTSNLHPHAYELLRTVVSITSLSRHHSLLHCWRWLRSHTVSARRTVSVAVFSSRVLVRVLVLDRLRAGATLCETQLKVVRHRSKQHSESIGCLAEDIL